MIYRMKRCWLGSILWRLCQKHICHWNKIMMFDIYFELFLCSALLFVRPFLYCFLRLSLFITFYCANFLPLIRAQNVFGRFCQPIYNVLNYKKRNYVSYHTHTQSHTYPHLLHSMLLVTTMKSLNEICFIIIYLWVCGFFCSAIHFLIICFPIRHFLFHMSNNSLFSVLLFALVRWLRWFQLLESLFLANRCKTH